MSITFSCGRGEGVNMANDNAFEVLAMLDISFEHEGIMRSTEFAIRCRRALLRLKNVKGIDNKKLPTVDTTGKVTVIVGGRTGGYLTARIEQLLALCEGKEHYHVTWY